ncbi:flagellar hook-associated protein 2 [Peribacillus deserti]|uniref:Flagellar hook-associated protein 2 n=1 Tax=Peribacillus deserti TaxID=673318 RepID=A0ABS2QCK5_9BACI|nr:flagellar hook-associated protein 2 [Peribacillus deserti]MBM7690892.1 flagellar hook-associated protein 2 [Peribacillus deserti]
MTRISGLASGMDTDQMVKDLMKAERMPLDKLNQKKQYTEWQRDDYRSMNKLLFDLDQFVFDGISKQGTYTKKTVTVSDPSAVTIKNINSTSEFSGTVKVNYLAEAATMFSTAAKDIDPAKTLNQHVPPVLSQTISIKAIGKDGKLETTGFSYTIDPSKDTLNSIIDKINKESGVNMFYDTVTQKVSITAKNTGNAGTDDNSDIELSGDFLINNLSLSSNNVDAKKAGFGSLGKNASFEINGLPTSRSTNNFQINGVDYTLNKKTDTPVTFSSSTDTDAILDTITKFVTKYNETISKINEEISEKRYREYQPLTKEQKDDMDEKDIEKWEERAKSGTLRGDSALSNGLNQLRANLYSAVPGAGFSQLSQIGITTSSNYLEKGKLVIDPDKLKAAISKNPNGIYELFQKEGATPADQGIARKMRASIKDIMSNIEKKAGKATMTNQSFTIGRLLDTMNNSINRFEDRLLQVEDRYYRQFTAMEKAIQKSNSQSTYLMQQFGGGQ